MLRMSIKYDTAVAEFYEIWMLKPSQRVKTLRKETGKNDQRVNPCGNKMDLEKALR
jgi:hypothetical protein